MFRKIMDNSKQFVFMVLGVFFSIYLIRYLTSLFCNWDSYIAIIAGLIGGCAWCSGYIWLQYRQTLFKHKA